MTGQRWDRLTDLFHAAIALPADQRPHFLATSCADDSALCAEAARLVAAHERSGDFIARPAVDVAVLESSDAQSTINRRFGPYRVVREIGRGGMGSVYLAERVDGQFEQRVAVKVIKRGMDSELVLQRFRAERQILASLEHSNIARLLDGGTTDDGRPYFVMEYIDGQPIDTYADAHRLSIAGRLQLFLRVASAVAYAHGRFVVHRDIKPVNILVTNDGVPKLLDFGIAKVLDPGEGEASTAVTGVRLLTPEYASPEQVEGRPATMASDVYSLGVVLYELLTGRSPYRLASHDPREVAEKVRTTAPDRPSVAVRRVSEASDSVSRRRRAEGDPTRPIGEESADRLHRRLRGDLDTIVMMALRKEPGRRYQRVEQLAEDIERHLQGWPVTARRDNLGYRFGKFVRRNRAAVVSASLASIGVLSAGAVAYRASTERDGDRSLRPIAGLTPRDRILVADFTDRSGDTSLAGALTEAIRVDLAQSPVVHVLSPRQVRAALTRMQRSPDVALDDSLALEVAAREGVKAVVTGSIARVAGRYALSAELLGAGEGDLLATERETARDSSDVILALGRLSERLRRRMGESLRSVRATPRLEQATTASLAALRAYSEAVRSQHAGDASTTIEHLRTAVALDTGFASAYRLLAIIYGDAVEPARGAPAMQHALANQARLPFYERYHLLATYAMGLGDVDAAIDAYHVILERYPDDVRALNNLALAHSFRREFAVQESLLVRAIVLDSTIPAMQTGLATAQTNLGAFDDARRTLDRVWKRYPGFFYAYLGETYLAAARQDWKAAERWDRQRLTIQPSDTLRALGGLEVLAAIVMTQGRLAESERHWRHVLALSAQAKAPADHFMAALGLARLELAYRRRPDSAIRIVDAALSRYPIDEIAEADRPYDELARFFAASGRPSRARDFIALAERTSYGRRAGIRSSRHWSHGVVAGAEGRTQDALTELRQASVTLDCPICVLPDLARAYEVAGRQDSAIAVYERYVRTPWEWRFETDDVELGWALKRLGELYAERGEHAKAGAMYDRLLQLWHGADDELQPVVGAVRERVAQ